MLCTFFFFFFWLLHLPPSHPTPCILCHTIPPSLHPCIFSVVFSFSSCLAALYSSSFVDEYYSSPHVYAIPALPLLSLSSRSDVVISNPFPSAHSQWKSYHLQLPPPGQPPVFLFIPQSPLTPDIVRLICHNAQNDLKQMGLQQRSKAPVELCYTVRCNSGSSSLSDTGCRSPN